MTATITDPTAAYRRACEDAETHLANAYAASALARLAAQDIEFGPDEPFPERPAGTPELRIDPETPTSYGLNGAGERRLHLRAWSTVDGRRVTFELGNYDGVRAFQTEENGEWCDPDMELDALATRYLGMPVDDDGRLDDWIEWVSDVHRWWTQRIARVIKQAETAVWNAVALDVNKRLV